jgi:hypothetical protein
VPVSGGASVVLFITPVFDSDLGSLQTALDEEATFHVDTKLEAVSFRCACVP